MSVEEIEQSLEALVCLSIDSTATKIDEKDLESFRDINFSQEHIQVITQFIVNSSLLLNSLQQSSNMRLKDLDWRLDAKV
jgi:hypothetical protein